MERTKAQYKDLKLKEQEAQKSLLESLEPRNKQIISCIDGCAKQFSEAKKSVDFLREKATKETMMKAHFKEFTREEFDKNYTYGLEPVMKGIEYHDCVELCQVPKEMSGRASKIGNDLIYLYHERCLMATK